LGDLANFAVALLGLSDPISLTKDSRLLFTSGSPDSTKPLQSVGLTNGDLILCGPPPRQNPPAAPAPAATGGLDFSALLNSASASASASAPMPVPPSNGGLTFNLAGLGASMKKGPVEWEGMTLDDAMAHNPNPDNLVPLLLNEAKHPNLLKELNYHSPVMAQKLRQAGVKEGPRVYREEIVKGSIKGALYKVETSQKEVDMRTRLQQNPNDAEAAEYFDKRTRAKRVDAQYRQMMEDFPESMGRVLMLYIDAEVNGTPIQAFVDSGAQSTIMSSACAKKCNLLDLLDTRFEGVAVGVGTGKILGRIHLAPMKIGSHFFPCTITVMDGEKGLGDKNMECLFGLDMLKRHRCQIDLEKHALVFKLGDNHYMETPFLHEHNLDESKGGTKGFDADKSNAEMEKAIQESMDESSKKKTADDAMDVDEKK
jgi:hypothetical protein